MELKNIKRNHVSNRNDEKNLCSVCAIVFRAHQFKHSKALATNHQKLTKQIKVKSLLATIFSTLILASLTLDTCNAGVLDFTKSTSETKETFLIYDLADFSAPVGQLKERVKEALIYRGDNAIVNESLPPTQLPKFPGKIEFKTMNFGPASINIPSCPGSIFTVSSSDTGGSSYGETARYMACAFPYAGGYRINFYASYVNASGKGLMGISKALAKAMTGAVGINADPQTFINTSIAKMEELFTASGYKYQIVEMRPVVPGKNLVDDPILKLQAIEAKRGDDRSKRMAARAELAKLTIDASDRGRLIKAIQSQDEDVISLFVEAGAIDFSARDETGKQLADYATKPSIRAMLIPGSVN
jgi:hypothetical protein